MTVLHINTEKGWRGGENQMCLLIKGLGELGVRSLAAVKRGSYLDAHRELLHCEVFPLPFKGELDFASSLILSRIVDENGVDIIHSHTSHAHTLGFFAKLFSRKKPAHIVTRRVDFNIYSKGSLPIGTYIKYRIMADRFIAISRKIKDVLESCGVAGDKIELAYSGLDMKRQSKARPLGFEPRTWVIGNIAHLADHKHHENLIEAFSVVARKIEAVLVIVGGGERMEQLKILSERLGIEKRVVFTGFREDAKDFYDVFDIFVVSSREEGLCTSIIDAFFRGVPVVATDAGGIPELVRHMETGLLVEKENPRALSKGILWAIENYGEMVKMAQRAKKLAENAFTDRAMVVKNYEIYKKVLRYG